MLGIAFAGFRHPHADTLYNWAAESENFRIVGAYEADPDARAKAQARGVEFNFSSYDDMLGTSEIDCVCVCDFYSARGGMIIDALRAGKHVIADKPLCTSLEELEAIEKTAAEKGLKVGCMLDLRYCAAPNLARSVVQSGRLGRVHNITFNGAHPLRYGEREGWYFETGRHGGTINDIAVHGIDLVHFITGETLERAVGARCWNAYAVSAPQFKDCAQFVAAFTGNLGVVADVSYAMPTGLGYPAAQGWRFTFWGENGIMEFNAGGNSVKLSLKDSDKPEIISGEPKNANPLTDFYSDICGHPQQHCTASVLSAAKDTLLIQRAAE